MSYTCTYTPARVVTNLYHNVNVSSEALNAQPRPVHSVTRKVTVFSPMATLIEVCCCRLGFYRGTAKRTTLPPPREEPTNQDLKPVC